MSEQPTISAYFSQATPKKVTGKRPSSPIEISDDESGRETKKRKTSAATSVYFQSPSKAASSSAGTAEQWRYSPEKPAQPRQEETKAQKRSKEEFRKRLLQQNNRFLSRKPSASPVPTAEDDRDEDDEEERSKKFDDLEAMFSNKPKAGGKRQTSGASKGKAPKKDEPVGPSGEPYTPLEKQVLELKKANPGTVLMVEVGYKYKFFGEDAHVAAKELGMVCYNDRNFDVATIPSHRRDIHLKKLLSQGYRVGVCDQTETAALKKVSDQRSAPFKRELTRLYTAATYVDDLDSVDDISGSSAPPFTCIVEESTSGAGADVHVAMISISPSSGDVVWDAFDASDNPMRLELEASSQHDTRLVHTRPAELLLPKTGLSSPTQKMLGHFTVATASGAQTRVEHFKGQMDYTDAFAYVSEFYSQKSPSHSDGSNTSASGLSPSASEAFTSGALMAAAADFPNLVVIALAHTIKHLSAFGLADALRETRFFARFAARTHMLLAGNTLRNLEIYANETDGEVRGSLLWVLDRTQTKFGARLLRSWVGRPLIDKRVLDERVAAVEELVSSASDKLVTLRQLLKRMPDLAKGLCKIQYGQCKPEELAILLTSFKRIGDAFPDVQAPKDVGFQSNVLNEIIYALPKIKPAIDEIVSHISLKEAAAGNREHLWKDPGRYPAVLDAFQGRAMVEVELEEELKRVRKVLRYPSLKWLHQADADYLIEVKKSENRPIPDDWKLVSRTKFYERYHTPTIINLIAERERYMETATAEARAAYSDFLSEIARTHYAPLRHAVNQLAAADCLLSLAQVAMRDGYVRPEFVDEDALDIVAGRHPMVEALRDDPFVPNDVGMGRSSPRSKIITGPNMGGKSSCVRMVALIAIMAQIGCYVPAEAVRMSLLDSVLTRMGASDDLARGRSTFMVEMTETSEILHTATDRSLVILDELGRGTSTFDGMAIADATMHYLLSEKHCKTLFITHYPLVATNLEQKFIKDVENLHMAYQADLRIDGTREITFLYRLTSGITSESFGVECGRLAGLPESVLQTASQRSQSFQVEVEARMKRNRFVPLHRSYFQALTFIQTTQMCSAHTTMYTRVRYRGGRHRRRDTNDSIGEIYTLIYVGLVFLAFFTLRLLATSRVGLCLAFCGLRLLINAVRFATVYFR
ncbi:muts domain V-domain-containing protein [Schizophyllum commune]